MAKISGHTGAVKIGSTSIAEVTNWTADMKSEISDVSVLGNGYGLTRGTLKSASGSVDFFRDPDNTQQNQIVPGAQLTLILVETTGVQITMPVTIESVSHDQSGPKGTVTRSASWQSNGAWS